MCQHETVEDTAFAADAQHYGARVRRFVCVAGHSTYVHEMGRAPRLTHPRACSLCGDGFTPPADRPHARRCETCVDPIYRKYGRRKETA
jgi:hypothetical protein